MKSISQYLSLFLPFLYLITVIYYSYIFFGRNKKFESNSTKILIILIVIHLSHIILRGVSLSVIPLTTKLDALSVLAVAIVILNLITELSLKTKSTGFFALSLSFLIQSICSIFYSWELLQNPWLMNSLFAAHVILTIFGYAAICISALYALFYIMLNHNIKHHRIGLIYDRLPPLKLLEIMSIRSVQISILTLGLGIFLGHLHAGAALDTYWPVDAKVIFSNVIWFGYFTGYIIAQFYKWRGKWMAYLSMIGFALLILVNISILFIENTFHNFQ
jgi:ABC-type uncharacterized transport system permease subunit